MASEEWNCVCSWDECKGFYECIRHWNPKGHVWNDDPVRIRFTRNKKTGLLPLRAEALYQGIVRYFPVNVQRVIEDEQESLPICLHHFPAALLEWKGRGANVEEPVASEGVSKIQGNDNRRKRMGRKSNSPLSQDVPKNQVDNGNQKKGAKKYSFKDPLTLEDIHKIEFGDDRRKRMGEKSNSFLFLCRKRLQTKAHHRTYKGLYVQSPMEAKGAVKSFVESLEPKKEESAAKGERAATRRERAEKRMAKKTFHTPAGKHNKTVATVTPSTAKQSSVPLGDITNVISTMQSRTPQKSTTGSIGWGPQPDDASPLCNMLSDNHTMLSPACKSTVPEPSCVSDDGWESIPLPTTIFQCQQALQTEFAKFAREVLWLEVKKEQEDGPPGEAEIVWDRWEALDGLKDRRAEMSESFDSFGAVPILSHILVVYFSSRVRFMLNSRGVWYCPCNNAGLGGTPDCSYFSVRLSEFGGRDIYCSTCLGDRRVELRKVRRLVDDPTRCRPVTAKTTIAVLHEVCAKRKRDGYSINRKVKRLLKKLKNRQEHMVVSSGSSVHAVLVDAVDYVKKNLRASREDLMRALMELELGDGGSTDSINDPVLKGEREEFVSKMLNNISNMSKKLNGKDSQCRYSPHILNAAMALYLRSPSAYDELRDSNVVCLPSPRRLRDVNSKIKVVEGGDPSLYFQFQQELNDAGHKNVAGHLMVDEVKLKNGIAFNSNSNVILGFVEGSFDLKEIYEQVLRGDKIVEEDEEGNAETPEEDRKDNGAATVYANQWRLRTTRGVVHNGDYFFNGGSLSGNEMLRQFNQVVKAYEFVDVKVMGLVCDAGGGNASFLKLLRKHEKVEGPWPTAKCVAFPNPTVPTRSIYVWTCSTHGLKALRNSLYKSQDQLARDFIRGDIKFGWRSLEDCFLRDLARIEELGLEPRSDLDRHAVYLDHYTVMNCRLAKQPFSERTISALIRHVAENLGVSLNWSIRHPSQWHKFHALCSELKTAASTADDSESKSTVCTIEFLIAVHGIFIERLLNRHFIFTKDNIATEKRNLQEAMQYFSDWISEREALENSRSITDRRESLQHYPAPQTYENLLLTVSGFVAYSEAILAMETNDGAFVPALHSNQSSIEAFFSQMRRRGRDRPDVYGGGVLQQNMLNSINANTKRRKVVRGNDSMYPAEDIELEHCLGTMKLHVDRLMAGKHMLRECAKTLSSVRDTDGGCSILSKDYKHNGTALGFLLGEHFQSQTIVDSPNFAHFCLTDVKFEGFFLLSLHAEVTNKTWFKSFSDVANIGLVNRMCRAMKGAIISLIEESLDAKARSHEASIESVLLSFVQLGGVSKLLDPGTDMHDTFDNSRCALVLFDFLKEKVMRVWLPEAVRRYRKALPPRRDSPIAHGQAPSVDENATTRTEVPSPADNICSTDENVNRFVGWAIWSVTRRYKAKLRRGISNKETEILARQSMQMLEDMKVLESEVLGNCEYLARFYPLDDAIRNKGTLTLVSPHYIDLLSKFSRYIGRKICLGKAKKHSRTGAIKEDLIASLVQDDMITILDQLLDLSEDRTKHLDITRVHRKAIFMEMFEKMMNAKIGTVIRQYRSDFLTRRNDTAHRPTLAVLSKGSNYNN